MALTNNRVSAGLLMFCRKNELMIFLVHPGGPYFKNKDDGFWGIPKGLIEPDEDHLAAAKREFEEETGIQAKPPFIPLGSVIQKGGKTVFAWAFEVEDDTNFTIICNTCELEWPPQSGKIITIPEVDKGEFFTVEQAVVKINNAQQEFITRLLEHTEK